MTKSNPKRRLRLFQENNICPFCGVQMILEELKKHESVPKNMGVLFHTMSRLDKVGIPQTILCCQKCCTEKNLEKHNALGIEELRNRASKQGHCICPNCGNDHIKSIKS